MNRAWRTLSAVLGACAVAACAQQAEVVKLYESPDAGDAVFQNLFVVVISSDEDLRQDFEHRLAAGLMRVGIAADPSHRTLPGQSEGMLQEDLNRAAAAAGSDAILVSHVVSVESSYGIEEGRSELKFECRGGDPVDYFLYDHEILKEPDSVAAAHTVVVISNLYDTIDHARIWTIQSTCFDKASLHEAIAAESDAVVRQLRIDRLVH
ncbi:MAG: hypothetical protein OEW35_09755 [Gammaproteobacteria bacterium]|nr:hypothetical protein [Gammaproteobacteria bacterium]MDH4253649.1 hypothetical protein [Gammaproteobacteria bacterium]MDH5309765.1 hypothetical protein [Gammaproteobacteria bacterium]